MDDRDRDVFLISLVQQHRHIYDKNSNYFRDKTAVETSWKIISHAMKTTGTDDDCQRRWCVLRNRYAKERRIRSQPDSQRKPWPLMASLSFLDEHVKRRRSYRTLSDMQGLLVERPNLNENENILSKPEKWEEIIIDEDEDLEEEEPDVKHVLSDADHSNASSYFADEEITIYKPPPLAKLPEIQPAPRIISTPAVENHYTEVEMPNTTEKPVEINTVLKAVSSATNPLATDEATMHFCMSLQESMQKIPKKFLTKAKIEILQVIDKYENAL